MLNVQFDNFIDKSFSFTRDKILDSSDLSKRVIIVALIALSTLAALYFAFKYCCYSLNKEDLFSDDDQMSGKLHFPIQKPKNPISANSSIATGYPYSSKPDPAFHSPSPTITDSDDPNCDVNDPVFDVSNPDFDADEPPINPNLITPESATSVAEMSPPEKENGAVFSHSMNNSNTIDFSDYIEDDMDLPPEFRVIHHQFTSPHFSHNQSPKQERNKFANSLISPVKESELKQERAAISAIKAKWLDRPQDEVQRVLNTHLLPPSLQTKTSPNLMPIEDLEKYMVMGRVLELKEQYKKTHYVFTHGQAPEASVINEFLKTCIRIITPHQYHPYRPTFRLPYTITHFQNANEFIKKYNATASNPSFKDDGIHSHEIISVDAQFANQAVYESALYFFSKGTNIGFTQSEKLNNIFKLNFLQFLPVETICANLAEKAVQIALKRKQETKVGVLYAICIPKAVVDDDQTNFTYASHAYGRACACAKNANRIQTLVNMQNNIETYCDGGYTQYRILTPRLVEEEGARCFSVSPLSKIKKNYYKQQIETVVKELQVYSHLYSLIEEIDEQHPDEVLLMQIESLKDMMPRSEQKHINFMYAAAKIAKEKAAAADAEIINKMNLTTTHHTT